MHILITCPFGLSSLLAKEIKKLTAKSDTSFSIETTASTFLILQGDWQLVYQLNLWSRIANKVYLLLGKAEITTFNQLFDFMVSLARNDYLPPSALLSLQVMTKHSQLFSERTLQSVAHKAILTALSTEKTALNTPVPIDIFLSLEDNQLNVWLNTSGASLHQRGRRKQTGPAPLKENLAAAMLLFSGWKFKAPLRDPFCGSGTIVIEAALLAKNLAPGLQRTFAFQSLKTFDSNLRNHLVQQAQQSVFSHPYQLMGSDINADVLVYAKQNAERANVAELITREQSDFSSASLKNLASDHSLTPRILTNPPYGKRIATGEELLPLYQKLSTAFQSYAGGVISAYPSIDTLFPASAFSHKSRYNGAEKVDFYYKKPLHS